MCVFFFSFLYAVQSRNLVDGCEPLHMQLQVRVYVCVCVGGGEEGGGVNDNADTGSRGDFVTFSLVSLTHYKVFIFG